MLEAVLPNAYRYELTAKVTKAPTPESIKAAQVGGVYDLTFLNSQEL